jgi:sec-independent protein translocase protein TatC
VLPEANRPAYLKKAASQENAAIVTDMLAKGASPEIDVRGNLQLMSALKPTETFMLSMKLSFFAGVVVAFPLLLLYILQFVLPGLHTHEQKVLWPALAIGFGLFLIGVCFAYFFVLPRALTFFYEWSAQLGVSNDWRIGEYITFATQFTLLFGLSFELPVVVMVFVKMGLLTHEAMRRTRAYAILTIFVVAAIITPTPDAFTLCLMAGPMVLLYELCIWLAYFDAKKAEKAEQEEERQRMERLLLDTADDEKGEEEDRSDPWDPSASEEGWQAGTETNGHSAPTPPSDDPPQSIPDEEKRRMSDLTGDNK